MPRKSDRERLLHMLDAAKDAISFTTGRSYEDFARNRMMQYAVLRCIEVVGEAGANVTPAYRAAHPDIPWREIIGMRNHLIHAYFDIDVPLTWRTVLEDLPPFITSIERLLQEEGAFQLRLPEP